MLSTVIFASCDEKLPTDLVEKKFSFEDIKAKINLDKSDKDKIEGYVSSNGSKLFFIIGGDKHNFEGEYGYVFRLNKGDKNVPALICYQKIKGMIKILPYKNVILALQENSQNEISSNELYMANEEGDYDEIGSDVADFEVAGDNIYEVSGKNILVYNGGKNTKITYEPTKSEGSANVDRFRESGRTVIIYDEAFKGDKDIYPMYFQKTKIDGSDVLTVRCTDGTIRIVPTNLEGLMEVVVTKIKKQKDHENQTSFTKKELNQPLEIKDLIEL